MKMKLLALVAVAVAGATVLFSGSALAAGPGPQDHSWTVSLSQFTAGNPTDYTVNLALGTSSPLPSGPTSFFSEATTLMSGFKVTQCAAKEASGTISGTCAIGVGAIQGSTSFTIQSNEGGSPGNIVPASGQPYRCGAIGTVTVPAVGFDVITGVTDTTSTTWPSTPSLVKSGYSALAEPDQAHGGAPHGATYAPDWYPVVLGGLGIPSSIVMGRRYGIAPLPGGGGTDVTFLTVKEPSPTGSPPNPHAAITILNNPIASFDPLHQSIDTCPPFSSTVTSKGTASAGSWACATNPESATTWATDFATQLSAVGGCTSTMSAPGGVWQIIDPLATGQNSFKIFLSSGAIDNGGTIFQQWDNCRLDPNGPDSVGNGIGDNCRTGTSYLAGSNADGSDANHSVPLSAENTNTDARLNAALACTSVETGHGSPGPQVAETTPPWAACQDANQNGALNQVDNCPLAMDTHAWTTLIAGVPQPLQQDTDRDGVGDLCDPNPVIKGDGTGYAPGFLVGTGSSGIATAGKYKDYNDICDDPFTVGGAMVGPSCLNNTLGLNVIMTSQGFAPDYLNPGAGACVQNFGDDSNHDGYVDGLQAQPNASVTCTGKWPPTTAPRIGTDPLLNCPGRLDAAHGGNATQAAAATLARYDVKAAGKIVLADLVAIAGVFNQIPTGPTDVRTLFDVQSKGKIVLADLVAVAGKFNQTVPAC